MSPAAPPGNLPAGYPLGWEHHVVLADGGLAFVRPAISDDAPELGALWKRLSPESRRLRSFGGASDKPVGVVEREVQVDYRDRMAFSAFIGDELVAFASFVRSKGADRESAEVAFAVEDAHQGRGLGTLLLEHLASYGAEHGLHRLTALVMAENRRMLEVFRDAGFPKQSHRTGGEIEVSLDIDPSVHSRKVIEARHRKALMAWDRARKGRRRGPLAGPA